MRGRGPSAQPHRAAPLAPSSSPHTAPHDELVSVVRSLVEASPRRSVVIDAVANALKARGFQRPPGSPRLVTRLRRIKELLVSASGTITLAEDGGPPKDEPRVDVAPGEREPVEAEPVESAPRHEPEADADGQEAYLGPLEDEPEPSEIDGNRKLPEVDGNRTQPLGPSGPGGQGRRRRRRRRRGGQRRPAPGPQPA
jgi:hypothetical protein